MDRDLKSGRTRLHNPRLNICLLGHPYLFIKILKDEKENYDDGLLQRFLISIPKPIYYSAEEIRQTPKAKISVFSILYTVNHLHINPITYKLSIEAQTKFDLIFTKYKNLVQEANKSEILLRFCIFNILKFQMYLK